MEQIKHYRPTKAVINLNAIKNNVENLKTHLSDGVEIIAVVKANAYGHGDIEVAKTAIEAGATMLAVATPDEAVHIRRNIPGIGILVLGASPPSFAHYAAEHNISLTAFSKQWVDEVEPIQHQLKLHIKIDSGMGRIGVATVSELVLLKESLDMRKDFYIEGIFTHFATADEEDAAYFESQTVKFEMMLEALGSFPKMVHVANTATALIKDAKYQYNAVRFGISMYGLSPSSYVAEILPFAIEPAMTLETELIHVKEIQAGDAVGYGATFIAKERAFVGTLPIGYADGMIRKLSGQEVLVAGKRVPIIGRICMDQCMVLLPEAYNIGEQVILIGSQMDETVSIDEWAEKLETINYEIPCILTSRVPRIYQM